jgi:hypothetical protein
MACTPWWGVDSRVGEKRPSPSAERVCEGTSVFSTAAILLVAVLLGLTLAFRGLRGRRVTAAWGYAHGALALLAVVALAVLAFGAGLPLTGNAALTVASLALVGGVFNLLFRLQGERPPGFMILLHGAAGVVALVLLLYAVAS